VANSFIAVFSAMNATYGLFESGGTVNGNIVPAFFSCSCHWFISVLTRPATAGIHVFCADLLCGGFQLLASWAVFNPN
jgi:hypothetical protein